MSTLESLELSSHRRHSTFSPQKLKTQCLNQPGKRNLLQKKHGESFASGRTPMTSQLHTELWTSWASLLRSYAAAHGMNATQHAVVEVSAEEITLRVGSRWVRFTQRVVESSDAAEQAFSLQEDGTVSVAGGAPEEMDIAAERFAREILLAE